MRNRHNPDPEIIYTGEKPATATLGGITMSAGANSIMAAGDYSGTPVSWWRRMWRRMFRR